MCKDDKHSNRIRLPRDGVLLAEDEKVILKAVSEEQKDYIMQVAYECSIIKHEFENKIYRKYLWEEFVDKNAAYYCIYDKKSKDFVGYCGINNLNKETPRLVIELLKSRRKQGYGYYALALLMDKFFEITGENTFCSRIEVDNYASQKLHKKLGAVPYGLGELFFHGDELTKYQKDNQGLIDENMRILATEFGVEPIKLIGSVLEYRIEWKRS